MVDVLPPLARLMVKGTRRQGRRCPSAARRPQMPAGRAGMPSVAPPDPEVIYRGFWLINLAIGSPDQRFGWMTDSSLDRSPPPDPPGPPPDILLTLPGYRHPLICVLCSSDSGHRHPDFVNQSARIGRSGIKCSNPRLLHRRRRSICCVGCVNHCAHFGNEGFP
jgi:hypothetical protein